MRLILSVVLLFSFGFTPVSYAGVDQQSVGRYSTVSIEPTRSQTDLFSVIINVRFSQSIKTVGEAIDHVLINSGYRLADLNMSDPNLYILLSEPLPGVHRSIGPITLRDALITLAGTPWDMVIDPVHRMISFELKAEYLIDSDKGDSK